MRDGKRSRRMSDTKKCDICGEEFEEWLEFHCMDGQVLTVCNDCMVAYPNEVNDKLDYINKHMKA